jgi:DnaJ like chaperone protein
MDQWTGKLIGALLGLLIFGPIGALVGLILGHQYDVMVARGGRAGELGGESTDHADGRAEGELPPDAIAIGEKLFRTSFRLMGHIAKADGRVSEQEISAARATMEELRLNPSQVRVAIEHFTAGKGPDFNLDRELTELRRLCAGRPDLLRIFVEIQVRAALAGNDMRGPARAILQRTATLLGISLLELAQLEVVLRVQW